MSHNASIYPHNESLHIEISAGYGDYIELRTADDWLELLRDLVAAGNAHFGKSARLVSAKPAVTFADDLTIDEAKYVIVELLKQFGVVKTHTVSEMLTAKATLDARQG